MKQELSTTEAADKLGKHVNWPYRALVTFIEYLEQLEDECDIQIVFDPIAFRCEYNFYESVEDFLEDYGHIEGFREAYANAPDPKRARAHLLEAVEDYTQVIRGETSTAWFIIQAF